MRNLLKRVLALLFAPRPCEHQRVVEQFMYRPYPSDSEAFGRCRCGATIVVAGAFHWFSLRDGRGLSCREDRPFCEQWRLHNYARAHGTPTPTYAERVK